MATAVREHDLELRLLKCSESNAEDWHNTQHARRKEWNCFTVIPPVMMYDAYRLRVGVAKPEEVEQMSTLDRLIRDDPAIIDSFFAFTITELGITYYPEEVGKTFNPLKLPPDDNDPHNLFGRVWPSEEYQHALMEMRIMEVLGLDLVELEELRKSFVIGGDIPRLKDSFDGVAYTSLQEKNTSVPYQELIRRLDGLFSKGLRRESEAGIILGACIEGIRLIAQDERLHGKYIAGIVNAGLHSGDGEVSSALIVALADQYTEEGKFIMPGRKMRGFKKRALAIARAEVFTPRHVRESKLGLLLGWNILNLTGLSASANSAQQRIGEFLARHTTDSVEEQ